MIHGKFVLTISKRKTDTQGSNRGAGGAPKRYKDFYYFVANISHFDYS